MHCGLRALILFCWVWLWLFGWVFVFSCGFVIVVFCCRIFGLCCVYVVIVGFSRMLDVMFCLKVFG